MDKNTFIILIRDLTNDIMVSFPEYTPFIHKWWKPDSYFTEPSAKELYQKTASDMLLSYCTRKVLPYKRAIMEKNECIFEDGHDTEFLPNIHFKNIWNSEITQTTKNALWNYLQLLILTVTSINEVGGSNEMGMGGANEMGEGKANANEMGDSEDAVNQLLSGNLGKIAKEIVDETMGELGGTLNSVDDVFALFMKNPAKMMGLIQKITSKLDNKKKKGELSDTDVLNEMGTFMKAMEGNGEMASMMANFMEAGFGKKAKKAKKFRK